LITSSNGMGYVPYNYSKVSQNQVYNTILSFQQAHTGRFNKVQDVPLGAGGYLHSNGWGYRSKSLLNPDQDSLKAQLRALLPLSLNVCVNKHSMALVRIMSSGNLIVPHIDHSEYGPAIGLLVLSHTPNLNTKPALIFSQDKSQESLREGTKVPLDNKNIHFMWGDIRKLWFHSVPKLPNNSSE